MKCNPTDATPAIQFRQYDASGYLLPAPEAAVN
jgi:hypothetical protein